MGAKQVSQVPLLKSKHSAPGLGVFIGTAQTHRESGAGPRRGISVPEKPPARPTDRSARPSHPRNGGLVTCKTGAVFWGSHTEYCGQRWREGGREESPQWALTTGGASPEAFATPQPRPHPAGLGAGGGRAPGPSARRQRHPVAHRGRAAICWDTGVRCLPHSHPERR